MIHGSPPTIRDGGAVDRRRRRTSVKIEVRLFANLADYLPAASPGEPSTIDLPDGATVDELVARLALPGELPRLLLVNGSDASPGLSLQAGDVVSILPPLAGG